MTRPKRPIVRAPRKLKGEYILPEEHPAERAFRKLKEDLAASIESNHDALAKTEDEKRVLLKQVQKLESERRDLIADHVNEKGRLTDSYEEKFVAFEEQIQKLKMMLEKEREDNKAKQYDQQTTILNLEDRLKTETRRAAKAMEVAESAATAAGNISRVSFQLMAHNEELVRKQGM